MRGASSGRTQAACGLDSPDAAEDDAMRRGSHARDALIVARGCTLASPQELLHVLRVARGDAHGLAEAAPTLRRLLLEVVAPHRVPAEELPRPAQLEALLRAP